MGRRVREQLGTGRGGGEERERCVVRYIAEGGGGRECG